MPRQRRFLTRPEPYYCLSSDLTDNFRLPDKGASDLFITLRSAAPDSALPPAGVRITPAYAAQLPKIQSATSVSALRTKNYAHHWRLMFLEYRANLSGYGDIIQLGSGDTSQYDLTPVAHYFELTFQADAGVAYHLWMRGKAVNNYWGNDSVYVQYSDSVTSAARQPHASARRPRKPSASRTA
jgi:hypothetical protein